MTIKTRGLLSLLAILLLIRLYPGRPLRDQVPQSTTIWSADGELLRATLAPDDQYRLWTPLKEVSPALVNAFRLKEDRWFYWHPGVNPVSLIRAARRTWLGHGRQGGSTLTMQLARLLYHLNTRTPAGKLKQSAAALWLEARYSKRSILEAYLNLAPFGGNIQGVGAASRIYFGKPPSQIDLGEAITLAVIPQRPAARSGRSIQQSTLLSARTQLANFWRNQNRPSDSERRQLELSVLAQPDSSLPLHAPHFTDAVLHANPSLSGPIRTTLDGSLQRLVERQIERYLNQFGERGIRNVATLLVDYRDMSVKSWVGSADYGNEGIHGQINGVLTKRSPGSTLKPFIYALALDQGVLHPRSILRDAPTSFGPFTPENFDGNFVGPIPAQEALIRSRNIPAVWVATQLRQPDLYQFLQSAGVGNMKAESYYGLALALGGGEVTVEELASLYAMLANQGVMQPIRTRPTEPKRDGVRLLSREASFITVDMLSRNPPADAVLQFVAGAAEVFHQCRDVEEVFLAPPFLIVALDGIADGAIQQAAVRLSLDQVVLGAGAKGVDAGLAVVQPGQHDDGHVRRQPARAGEGVQPAAVRQRQVQQDYVRRVFFQRLEAVGQRGEMRQGEGGRAALAQQFAQEQRVAGIVLHQQDIQRPFAHPT